MAEFYDQDYSELYVEPHPDCLYIRTDEFGMFLSVQDTRRLIDTLLEYEQEMLHDEAQRENSEG